MKKVTLLLVVLLALSIATVVPSKSQLLAQSTLLSIVPSSIVNETLTPGSTFNVNVTVTDITNLFAYEFKIYYTHVINGTLAIRPSDQFLVPLLDPGNSFVPKWAINNNFNATHGQIWLAYTLLAPETGRTGSGVLAVITFLVVGTGQTPLTLSQSKLPDPNAIPIPHTDVNGFFSNEAAPPPPPPAKIYVDPKTIDNATLTPGTSFTINVDIVNGTQVFSFAFKLSFSSSILAAANITEGPFLNSSGATTISMSETNNTGGYVRFGVTLNNPPAVDGNGVLATIAFNVVGNGTSNLNLSDISLKDSSNNSLTFTSANGTFKNTVGIEGDLNGDGRVDIQDIVIAAMSFGTTPASPNWNPVVDFDGNGVINVLDLVLLTTHWTG